jgi:hypothetical protein
MHLQILEATPFVRLVDEQADVSFRLTHERVLVSVPERHRGH